PSDQRARLRPADGPARSSARPACRMPPMNEKRPSARAPCDRDRGELVILLHSHMPYVEGFGTWPFGEEWLLEAIAVCYLPLIDLLERAGERHGRALATVGLTPVLADQLSLPVVGERFLGFMHGTRADCHRLDIAGLEAAGN